MPENRPYALSIAGFDPTGGAGVLADIKTFEQHQVSGFAISTANTLQTENQFYDIQWTDLSFVIRSVETLFKNYKIKAVKIGITPDLNYLSRIVSAIKLASSTTKIVWDPVLKSTTQFEFLKITADLNLYKILCQIDLITPNYKEAALLFPDFLSEDFQNKNEIPTAVLVKGGHNEAKTGTDYLFLKDEIITLLPSEKKCFEKHGSGCVLSAAIASNFALNQTHEEACKNAKIYIEKYLSSTPTLIGYHYVP
ncbi:MAG: hydroxymethylpyrimidine/phosphomethylpyrimidine kinase [Flavobacterium circumlabens]|uniref:hydroxymethylpyrimidine/phosphomethylpyrimidine kinase n=1 Tax=Flavobacterium circumlabens TaxID=2133765 RepID=UPI00326689F9